MDKSLRSEILAFVRTPKLHIDRARIVTKAHKEHEKELPILRRAEAFCALAREMPVKIYPWQLVVGSFASEPFSVSLFPESCWRPVLENLDDFSARDGDKYIVDESDKKELREMLPWWEGRSIQDAVNALLPDDVRAIYEAGVCDSGYLTSGSGNFSADYEKVIRKGLFKIRSEIQEKYDALDPANGRDLEKWLYYKSVLLCCDGAMDFALRHSRLAADMAKTEQNPARKKELEKIAKTCARAISYPAENFYEAVQTFWFLHILLHYETAGGAGVAAGRLDQYLYPFYKPEEEGEIRAFLKNLWINYNQVLYFLPGRAAKNWAGHPVSEQPTIGGVTKEGADACNELTEMILEIEREVAMPQPDIALMYHENMNPKILGLACDSLLSSMKPKIFGLDAIKKQGQERGIFSEEDLINGVDIGCVATGPQGKSWGNNGIGFFSLGKVLEITLYNGVDPRTGKKIGIETGDVREMTSYDALYGAFKRQLSHMNRLMIRMTNLIEKVHAELSPQPFTSILIDDCLEKGLPLWKGGARYNIPGAEAVGLANAADSLAAIKKLVFEEKKIAMQDLLAALKADFAGKEYGILRARLQSAPKYGNDDDFVDEIARDVAEFFCDEHAKYKSPRGCKYCPSICSVSAHVGLGGFVGALPDGKKAFAPLADGMSPSQGACRLGPTAVVKSLSKIDQKKTSDGNLLNMKFAASILKNPETREKFLTVLRGYMALGGFHVQYNLVDTAQLKDAQQHPEKYPELIVRVAAYVAQFAQLPKSLQDDIIARSELTL